MNTYQKHKLQNSHKRRTATKDDDDWQFTETSSNTDEHTQSLGPRASPEDKDAWQYTSGEVTKYMYGRKRIVSLCRPVYQFQECRTVPNCWLHLFRFTPLLPWCGGSLSIDSMVISQHVVTAFPSDPWSSPVWWQPFHRLQILSGPLDTILAFPGLTLK